MTTTRVRVALAAIIVTLIGTLSGCGGSGNQSESETESEETSTSDGDSPSPSPTPRPVPTASLTAVVGERVSGEGPTTVTVDRGEESGILVIDVEYTGIEDITLNDVGGDPFVGPVGPPTTGFAVLLDTGGSRDAFEVLTEKYWSLTIKRLVDIDQLSVVDAGTGPNIFRLAPGPARNLGFVCTAPTSSLWTVRPGADGWEEAFNGDATQQVDLPISDEMVIVVVYCSQRWSLSDTDFPAIHAGE